MEPENDGETKFGISGFPGGRNHSQVLIVSFQGVKMEAWGMFLWLVVSTHLKNIRQIGHLPQIGVKIKNLKPPPSYLVLYL